jgi:hypothetical protein
MTIGGASPSGGGHAIRRTTIHGTNRAVIERLSVPAGSYIITATCTLTLTRALPEGTAPTVYTLELRLGDFAQRVSGRLTTFAPDDRPVNEYQPAAVTLGAEVDRRSSIELSATLSTVDTIAFADDPSITAIQVDTLHFSRIPGHRVTLAEVFWSLWDYVRERKG